MTVQATDPDPVQDFCVGDLSAVRLNINGYSCLDSALATAEDFSFSGISTPADLTGNPINATATFGFVRNWVALNTLGLSIARLDLNPGGVIMPHKHNFATQILYVLEGEIYTGFVSNSNNPGLQNKLYAKVVKQGEAFIFPRGLLHFQINKGTVPAANVNFLKGQEPGIQLMPVSLFGSGIDPEASFFVDEAAVANMSSVLTRFVKIFN